MSSLRVFLLTFAATISVCQSLLAADVVVHILRSSTMTANVDNNGGYGIPDANPEGRFQFFIGAERQLGEGSLILTDDNDIYNGRADDDYVEQSDVALFNAMGQFGTADVVTLQSNMSPVQFQTLDGRFTVRQTTFARSNRSYVIYKWQIQNTAPTPTHAKVLFLNDWDLFDTEGDQDAIWESGRRLAYQIDADLSKPVGFQNLAAGVSLLEGNLHQYHLGNCCDFRETDAQLNNYFQDDPMWIGDIDTGNPDKEVGVSADLGLLAPNQSACVVFVQALGTNVSPSSTVDDLRNQVDDAANLWSSLPASSRCTATNPVINAGMNSAWVNANAPLQGHFLTVYPDAGLIFQSWFTFDSALQAQALMQSEGSGTKLEQAATFGADDQRWVTALGFIDGNKATLTVENTSGGIFNGSEPLATQDGNYGTITLEFLSCGEAIMTYDFPSVGLSGTDTLTRAVDDSEICEMLAAGEN